MQKIKEIRHKMMCSTMRKYNLIRIRIKISWHSFHARTSICELFLKEVLASYSILRGQPEILKYKGVIAGFETLMKKGGKGFCPFLITYSLAQGYLEGDDLKSII